MTPENCMQTGQGPIIALQQAQGAGPGVSQTKSYVGNIPDIFPNDSEKICLEYP